MSFFFRLNVSCPVLLLFLVSSQDLEKFSLFFNPTLISILLQWIGHQRFIYNAKVSEDRYYRVFAQKAVSLSGTAMSKSAALSLPCEWARQL